MKVKHMGQKSADPRLRAEQLGTDALWYKDAIIYEVHVRAFQDSDGDGMGDFRGLMQRLPYLEDLGVTCLWVLPFCPSPWKDDGYDISDYTDVHPAYGTLRDFQAFLNEAHRRGMRVITELVMNHTSDQHVWFQRSRRAPAASKWRNYYVWSDTPEKYQDARIIFKDFETSNWTHDPVAKSYFWHRFYSHQPDLNFDSPDVRAAMKNVLDFWFDLGIDGLRLDAVPYLFEREGTDCENLPETHAFLRDLRAHIDAKYPGRMLLAEANQWPEDAIAYFGNGDECNMAFHFPLMPRLFMATRMGDRYPVTDILQITPPIPDNSQWALFLRNHDELTLEMVTDEERDYMYRVYAHDRSMRINLGIRRRLAPLVENDRRRIELLNGLLFSLPGTPVIYYGDEIGMGDNFYLGDRNGVRTPMQWNRDRNSGFSNANPQRLYLPIVIDPEYHYEALNIENQQNNAHSLLWWMKRLINQRKQSKAFGRGSLEFIYPENRRILAFTRTYENERILVVANLSRVAQGCHLPLSEFRGMTPVEMFGNSEFPVIGEEPYFLSLAPHAFYWFQLQPLRTDQETLRRPTTREGIPAFAVNDWAEVLTGENRRAIQRYLPELVRTSNWLHGRNALVTSAAIYDVIRFESVESFFVLVRVEFSTGDPEIYAFTLSVAHGERMEEVLREAPETVLCRVRIPSGEEAILYGGSRNPQFRDELLGAVSRRKRYQGDHGVLAGSHTTAFRDIWKHDPSLDSTLRKADYNGTSISYGERFFLKLFRRLEPGKHPALEVSKALTAEKDGAPAPRLGGWLEYRPREGESFVAGVLQEYVPNETDAWSYTIDNLRVFFETALAGTEVQPLDGPPDLAALLKEKTRDDARTMLGNYLGMMEQLGRRAAELHLSLAKSGEYEFTPEPFTEFYRLGLFHSMLGQRNRVFQQLRHNLDNLPPAGRADAEKLILEQDKVTRMLQFLRDKRLGGLRLRIHGNLNLHNVLYTGRDFSFVDFEGQPERPVSERRIKRSALRDVAGLLQSLFDAAHGAIYGQIPGIIQHDAAIQKLEPWAITWYGWVASELLRGYFSTPGIDDLLPPSREDSIRLLEIYVIEQSLRNISENLLARPEWIRSPVRSILNTIESQK
jgi:maltose alpha-D-glucosyltransferase/alpha-amylase